VFEELKTPTGHKLFHVTLQDLVAITIRAKKNHSKSFAELSPYWSTINSHPFISHFKDFSSTNFLSLFVTLSPLSTESFQPIL